jgi:hypothetical protein
MSQGGSSWGHGNWLAKCGDILTAVQQHLGLHAAIFNQPVDTAMYPDYPKFVSHPCDMGTIRSRLDRQQYSSPQEFCDVRSLPSWHIHAVLAAWPHMAVCWAAISPWQLSHTSRNQVLTHWLPSCKHMAPGPMC